MTKILIVSNSLKFSRVLDYTLSHNGFTVEVATTFEKAMQFIEEIHFRLVLMDVPFCEDFLLKEISCPVIAMGESYDEVSMLGKMYQGVDDYILKPFGIPELRMIMNKQLERFEYRSKPLVYGDLKIDVVSNVVTVRNKMLSLGKKEFEILLRLTKKAGKIVVTDSLLTKNRIAELTRKLEREVGNALQIKYISGLGYKLVAPAI